MFEFSRYPLYMMRRGHSEGVRKNLLWISLVILFTTLKASDVVIEERESSTIISKDEELIRKSIGPLNKYELLNSFPSMYSTEVRKKGDNLLQVYDSNLYRRDSY